MAGGVEVEAYVGGRDSGELGEEAGEAVEIIELEDGGTDDGLEAQLVHAGIVGGVGEDQVLVGVGIGKLDADFGPVDYCGDLALEVIGESGRDGAGDFCGKV